MAAHIGVTNLDGFSAPPIGAIQQRQSEEVLGGIERERGADGNIQFLVPHKYKRKEVRVSGVGAVLADVGSFAIGAMAIVRARQDEFQSALPRFERTGVVIPSTLFPRKLNPPQSIMPVSMDEVGIQQIDLALIVQGSVDVVNEEAEPLLQGDGTLDPNPLDTFSPMIEFEFQGRGDLPAGIAVGGGLPVGGEHEEIPGGVTLIERVRNSKPSRKTSVFRIDKVDKV